MGAVTSDIFAGTAPGQEQAKRFLQAAYDTGRTTHAYLIAGNENSGKMEIALRFAAALVAGDDAEQRDAALRRVHPDLHVLEPASAQGYLVAQIREVVRDAELAPIRAGCKVYILDRAERLRGAPANAFLKTLEEPPADVVCILLASTEKSVLETLRSRCEVIALNEVDRARPGDALVFEMMAALAANCGNRVLLGYAKRLAESARTGSDELVKRQEAELEASEDYLSSGARKEIEQRNKREVSSRERAALLDSLAVARTWLRDCLVTQAGTPELISYTECAAQTLGVATMASARGLLNALEAVNTAMRRVSYNVTPQLACEAMCLEIREAICRQ